MFLALKAAEENYVHMDGTLAEPRTQIPVGWPRAVPQAQKPPPPPAYPLLKKMPWVQVTEVVQRVGWGVRHSISTK